MSTPPPPPPPPGAVPPPPPFGGTPGAAAPYGSFPTAPPPYGYSTNPPYAGFGVRLAGYLLDGLLYGLVLAVFGIPTTFLAVASVEDCDRVTARDGTTTIECAQDQLKGGLLAAAIAIGVIGVILVAVLYLRALGTTGQTWGRKIVGVKVVGKDTQQPLGIGKAFLRQIIEAVVGQACILSYLWMLWDKDKQTWHDKIVSSVVIRV